MEFSVGMEDNANMEFSTGTQASVNIRYPEWQKQYQEALLEVDDTKLGSRIGAAEGLIFKRLQAISGNSDHHAERQAMEDALSSLRILKRGSRAR